MEQSINPKFKNRFAELRAERNMSQKSFAEFLGIARPTVGFYENGERIPDAQILAQIADRCGVSSDWLLGRSDYRRDEGRGYNLEEMCFTEKAANALDRLSTVAFLASHQDDPSEESKRISNAYGLFIKILEDSKFIDFLCNASIYVAADPNRWANPATMTISDGKEIIAPAAFAKDLFWAHCTAPLKECLDKIEFIEKA